MLILSFKKGAKESIDANGWHLLLCSFVVFWPTQTLLHVCC